MNWVPVCIGPGQGGLSFGPGGLQFCQYFDRFKTQAPRGLSFGHDGTRPVLVAPLRAARVAAPPPQHHVPLGDFYALFISNRVQISVIRFRSLSYSRIRGARLRSAHPSTLSAAAGGVHEVLLSNDGVRTAMLRSDHGCAHCVTLTSRILDGMCALWCRDMCRGPCGTVRAAAQSTRSPDASRYTHALQTYTPATWRHCARVDISTGSVCRQQPRDGAQPMALPMDHERNVCHQACALVAAWQSQEPTYCCVVRVQG